MISFSFKKLSDQDLVTGLQNNPSQNRRYENILYERYIYLVDVGIKKHHLTQDEAISVYSDTVLAAIKQIKERDLSSVRS
jgi:RNA polymerase sigma-70 factor (ECF subfamily)